MRVGDWQQVVDRMPADTPVLFCVTGKEALQPEEYCQGDRVLPSRMWDGSRGWRPCVLVELGEAF